MMPNQKLGMLMPNSPKVVPVLSTQELGLAAAHTPKGMAKMTAMMTEAVASSRVAGIRLTITSSTGSSYLKERPKSPWTADMKNLTYWT